MRYWPLSWQVLCAFYLPLALLFRGASRLGKRGDVGALASTYSNPLFVIDVARQGAAATPSMACGGDVDIAHAGQVDDQAIVEQPVAGDAVAAAHRQRQAVPAQRAI